MNENKNETRFGLSLAQQDIYLDQIHKEKSPLYNIGGYIVCRDIDVARLTFAHQCVMKNTETFGIHIGDVNGDMFQYVSTDRDLELPLVDFSHQTNPQKSSEEFLSNIFSVPINFTGSLLYKAWLLKLSENTFWYVGLAHHIVVDGFGFSNWARQIAEYYNEPSEGEKHQNPSLFWDEIVSADSSYLESKRYQNDKEHWRTHFKNVDKLGLIPQYNITSENAHPQTSARYSRKICRERFSDLEAFAKKYNVRIPQVFLGILASYFSKVYDKKQVCFGIPVHNRRNYREKNFIGVFTGISPLVIDVPEKEYFKDFVQQIAKVQMANYRHQRYPLGHLIFDQNLSAVENPVFEVMFNFLNFNDSALAFSGVDAELVFAENRFLTSPLGINVWDGAGEVIELQFDYHLAYFSDADIQALANRLDKLLNDVLVDSEILVSNFDVLTESDRKELTSHASQAQRQPLPNATIIDLFEEQVKQNPTAVAVACDGRELTYDELNGNVNQLAGFLSERHEVGSGSIVGVCMSRSLEMLTAILAILKVGGIYIPIDPEYPESRITYMVKDAKPSTIITERNVFASFSTDVFDIEGSKVNDNNRLCIFLDDKDIQQLITDYDKDNLSIGSHNPQNLAYVIYTSGSTGKPKGVMVEHHSLTNFLLSMQKTPGMKDSDCLLAVTSTSFDIHGLELFLPLISGARLVIASKQATQDPQMLQSLIEEHSVSVMQATPSTWKLLLEIEWQPNIPLKVLCGGEDLPWSLAQSLLSREKIQLWNMYGPTETTIWSSIKHVGMEDQKVLIGMPIANTRFYVVNKQLELVPKGIPGELLIAGRGVARGYLGKEELTQNKFISIPSFPDYDSNFPERLYRTGDLVRMRGDGNYEYLGRTDQQIKIRGHRIEIGEIETALTAHCDIKDAVVIAKEMANGDKQLASFIVEKKKSEGPSVRAKNPNSVGFSLFYFGATDSAAKYKYDLYLKSAKFADEHKFEAIWTPERHFDPVGALYPNPSLLSAAVATITDRIALRAGSVVLPLHDPIRVAEEWAMVDNLSNGRAGLAIASGWHPRDFVISPDNYDTRKQLLREGVQILKNLWQGKTIQRSDGRGNKVDIEIFPKPTQKSLPIWITAAGNPETFIEAGRLGTNVLTHLLGQNIEELKEKIAMYRESLSKHGHNPDTAKVTLMIHTFVGADLDDTLERARRPFLNYMRAHLSLLLPILNSLNISTNGLEESELETIADFAYERYTKTASLIGTPESCIDVVAQVIDAGVDEIACFIDWMDDESAFEGLEPLKQLADQSRELSISRDLQGELRQHLAKFVPDYMLPASYTLLEELPLTPNGKIDRKALQEFNIQSAQKSYVPPESELEHELVQIWAEVLGLEPESVSVKANFFALGGNSLNATKLTAKISKAFDCSLLIKVIFEKPTIQEQAIVIQQLSEAVVIPVVVLPAGESSNDYELSSSQSRLWFLDKLQGKSSDYNMSFEFKVVGKLDLGSVHSAFSQIINRHEILRTRFVERLGLPRQQIVDQLDFKITELDLSDLDKSQATRRLEALRAENRQHIFDISKDMLLTICFIKMPQRADFEGMLLFNMHHIIADGWSVNILLKEFATIYQSLINQQPHSLPQLPVQYKDYANWQRNQEFDSQLRYWENLLADAPAQHSLPTKAQSDLKKGNGSLTRNLSKTLSKMLKSMARETESTLFMIIQPTIAVHIGRLSHEKDVVVGAPVSGRNIPDIDNLVGLFINTMVFRTEFSHNPSLLELLKDTRLQHLTSHAHDIPFENLVGHLNPFRNFESTPIFQILINHDSADVSTMKLPGCELQTCEQGDMPCKYDITIYIDSFNEDQIRLTWVYNSGLFDKDTMAMFVDEYEHFLAQVLTKPSMPVLDASWKTFSLSAVVGDKKNESVKLSAKEIGNNVMGLFDRQANTTPEASALVFEQKQYTYKQLQNKVNQYARYLRKLGISMQSRVAIAISRNDERILAILATLKLGACYIPLSSELPRERLVLMLEESKPDLLLHDTNNLFRDLSATEFDYNSAVTQMICTDTPEVDSNIANQSVAALDSEILQHDSEAHIIFTSGSTGKPKGVIGTHGATYNRIKWMLDELPYESDSVANNENVVHITSMAFIRGVWELLVPLCGGACLHLLPRNVVKDSLQLHERLVRNNISRLVTTPSMLKVISEQDKNSATRLMVRHWFVSGEPLLASHVNELVDKYPAMSIYNLYGSTEIMSDVLWHRLQNRDVGQQHNKIELGQPISGVDILVYADNRVVPKNAVGELVIVGDSLSKGYLDSSFDSKNFLDTLYGRGYKTGDLVVMTAENQIYYQGRCDDQIKIRGYRIERDEIMHTINQHPQVSASYIKVDSNSSCSPRLIAYLVPTVDLNICQASLSEEVKSLLSKHLPDYMIPTAYVCLEAFPLRPNGKINHQQLPAPSLSSEIREPPKGANQIGLAKIWSHVLDIETEVLDVNINFFDLGGHSLMVSKVLKLIEQEFRITMSYKDFFENSSIKLQSKKIEELQLLNEVVNSGNSKKNKLTI